MHHAAMRRAATLVACAALTLVTAACSSDSPGADAVSPDAELDALADRGRADVDSTRDSAPSPDVDSAPPDAPADLPHDGAADVATGDTTADVATPDSTADVAARDSTADAAPPLHTRCADAKTLQLSAGKVTVSETTVAQTNEYGAQITCGQPSSVPALSGTQLYYRVRLTQGKVYSLQLSPIQLSPLRALYVASGCGASTINTDCASAGKTGLVYDTELLDITALQYSALFAPTQTADYIVVVETYDDFNGAAFTLTIEELTGPSNTTCNTAQKLAFSAGRASVSGTTDQALNEFGAAINCGSVVRVDGPQLYYSLDLKAGKGYRFNGGYTMGANSTSGWSYNARMVLFGSTCDVASINTDCGSHSVAGAMSGMLLAFTPPADATYTLAIDGRSREHGDFALTVDEYTPVANSACANAQALPLIGGKGSVSGDLAQAINEFGGQVKFGTTPLSGPQLYYTVYLTGGTTYDIALLPDSVGMQLLLFGATCSPATINSQIVSGGQDGLTFPSGWPLGSATFTPSATGTYTIAVEDLTPGDTSRKFTLMIEEHATPTNTTCAAAQPLALQGGTISVLGDTAGSTNEFGSQITCGTTTPLAGPQLSYSVALTAGTFLEIDTLAPSGSKQTYVTGDTCDPATINSQCASAGASGLLTNWVEALFVAPADGTYRITVEQSTTSAPGPFVLRLTELAAAANTTCQTAQTVTLAGATTTVNGDTTAAPDEFGSAVACGQTSPFVGSQVYYKVDLVANTTYTFTLTPSWGSAALYVFSDTCAAATIEADCSSGGASGAVTMPASGPASVTFTPSVTGTYRFAVDSTYVPAIGTFGAFEVTITH